MAYVPGYQHDVFISYAHGDDRDWISRLVDRLGPALKQRLGLAPSIWIDDDKLRASRDFSQEIPETVKTSAVFVLLPSPTYIRSVFCVREECRTFESTVASRRARFGPAFANDLFVMRCPILPVDDDEHWALFPGASDIRFCNDVEMLAIGSPEFDAAFRRLVGELVELLKRMRNQSTAVFLYPPQPAADLRDVHRALSAELSAQSYRILPDRPLHLSEQLGTASLAVFLLGAQYDEGARELIEAAAARRTLPWIVWCSPAADQTAAPEQSGFAAYLEQLESGTKTFLDASIVPSKLKEEILGVLRPNPRALAETNGKPRVYLVYNSRDRAERTNAGLISFHFRNDVHFEHPDDPAQHTMRLANSDGVLLVWGSADEDWCAREFGQMVQVADPAHARGMCVFQPVDVKLSALRQLRAEFANLYISEQPVRFDPARLATFFTPLVRRSQGAAR
jgi:hypothetical protein